MKVFIVLSALCALAVARPGLVHAPLAYTAHVAPLAYAAPVVPVEVSSQYHAQDSLGQYNYGYAGVLSSKAETKTFDGVTRGAYSYVDAEGKVQNVQYTADSVNGFQVSASNLPVAPKAVVPEPVEAPKPVEDTPEVAQAKEAHFAAVKEAETLAALPEPVAAPVAVTSYAAPVTAYAAPVVAPVAAYAAPAVTAYSHYPSAFGYHYPAVAPYHVAPYHVAAPFVEVKAKSE